MKTSDPREKGHILESHNPSEPAPLIAAGFNLSLEP